MLGQPVLQAEEGPVPDLDLDFSDRQFSVLPRAQGRPPSWCWAQHDRDFWHRSAASTLSSSASRQRARSTSSAMKGSSWLADCAAANNQRRSAAPECSRVWKGPQSVETCGRAEYPTACLPEADAGKRQKEPERHRRWSERGGKADWSSSGKESSKKGESVAKEDRQKDSAKTIVQCVRQHSTPLPQGELPCNLSAPCNAPQEKENSYASTTMTSNHLESSSSDSDCVLAPELGANGVEVCSSGLLGSLTEINTSQYKLWFDSADEDPLLSAGDTDDVEKVIREGFQPPACGRHPSPAAEGRHCGWKKRRTRSLTSSGYGSGTEHEAASRRCQIGWKGSACMQHERSGYDRQAPCDRERCEGSNDGSTEQHFGTDTAPLFGPHQIESTARLSVTKQHGPVEHKAAASLCSGRFDSSRATLLPHGRCKNRESITGLSSWDDLREDYSVLSKQTLSTNLQLQRKSYQNVAQSEGQVSLNRDLYSNSLKPRRNESAYPKKSRSEDPELQNTIENGFISKTLWSDISEHQTAGSDFSDSQMSWSDFSDAQNSSSDVTSQKSAGYEVIDGQRPLHNESDMTGAGSEQTVVHQKSALSQVRASVYSLHRKIRSALSTKPASDGTNCNQSVSSSDRQSRKSSPDATNSVETADHHAEQARQTDREEIRRRLAMGAGDDYSDYYGGERALKKPSLSARLQGGMNLQICFVNEAAALGDDLGGSSNNVAAAAAHDPVTLPSGSEVAVTTASSSSSSSSCSQSHHNLSSAVTSFRAAASSVFTPTSSVTPRCSQQGAQSCKSRPKSDPGLLASQFSLPPSDESIAERQIRLQQEAKMALAQASTMARMQLEVERKTKKKSPIADIVGVPELGSGRRMKISRKLLHEMNLAQLQVLVNDLHSQIENLNEELVHLLIERDDLHMEQDSMLVDIEDLTSFAQHMSETNNNKSSQNNRNSAPSSFLSKRLK